MDYGLRGWGGYFGPERSKKIAKGGGLFRTMILVRSEGG